MSKLDELSIQLLDARRELQQLQEHKAKTRADLLGPELLRKLDEIEAVAIPEVTRLTQIMDGVELELKRLVVEQQATHKAAGFQVVFVQPEPTWDGPALRGYAAAHPEINQFQTPSKPRAQLRWGK